MNKELKLYLEKEIDKILKDFRIRLNKLLEIKDKLYNSGIDLDTPSYLTSISKLLGKDMKYIYSYANIDDIYEQNKLLLFDLMDILDCIKKGYVDYPLSDIRFLIIALNMIKLDDKQYKMFLKYILSLIKRNAIWHVNIFNSNCIIERKLANLIDDTNSVYDEYTFISYLEEWAISFYRNYPYVLDYDIIYNYFIDNKRLIKNLIELQSNKDYYLNGNYELRELNNLLPPLVAKALEERFKFTNFKDENDFNMFMNEVRMTINDKLGIQIYEERCRTKINLNKNYVKKLQMSIIKRSDN